MIKMPPGPDTVQGIDVSKWDAHIDFQQVKKAGREFVFAKCSEYNVDRTYERNRVNAKAAGLIVGAYHFFHPSRDPLSQAEVFLHYCKLGTGDLLPVLDWESTDDVQPDQSRASAKIWLERVERAIGKAPIIYTSPYFAKALKLDASWSRYPLWIAHYGVRAPLCPSPWPRWDFWQYTSEGEIPGIPTDDEDFDLFNGTLETLKSKFTI